MRIVRFFIAAVVATVVGADGFNATTAVAQEKHEHAAGHHHEATKQAEQKIADALKRLPHENQKLAAAQRFCAIKTYARLGAMGTPLKLMIEGKPVFVCCKACVEDAQKDGAATAKTVERLRDANATLAKLPKDERLAIEAQKYCAVANTSLLGSMGAPIKLTLDGKPVYLCCKGCTTRAQANPAATLAKVEELRKAGTLGGHDHAGHKH